MHRKLYTNNKKKTSLYYRKIIDFKTNEIKLLCIQIKNRQIIVIPIEKKQKYFCSYLRTDRMPF
jgi:hypothetical protein